MLSRTNSLHSEYNDKVIPDSDDESYDDGSFNHGDNGSSAALIGDSYKVIPDSGVESYDDGSFNHGDNGSSAALIGDSYTAQYTFAVKRAFFGCSMSTDERNHNNKWLIVPRWLSLIPAGFAVIEVSFGFLAQRSLSSLETDYHIPAWKKRSTPLLPRIGWLFFKSLQVCLGTLPRLITAFCTLAFLTNQRTTMLKMRPLTSHDSEAVWGDLTVAPSQEDTSSHKSKWRYVPKVLLGLVGIAAAAALVAACFNPFTATALGIAIAIKSAAAVMGIGLVKGIAITLAAGTASQVASHGLRKLSVFQKKEPHQQPEDNEDNEDNQAPLSP